MAPIPISPAQAGRFPTALGRVLPLLLVVGTAFLLWLPRLEGPVDLRYDAAVYYLLGSSLAEGRGYRISSEPGEPTGVQYPPGLPVLVAMHQRALGSTDWLVVAPALRRTYFVLTLCLAVAVYLFARSHLNIVFAGCAGLLTILQVETFTLTDLLFTETPFTLLALCFVALLWKRREAKPAVWSESVAFLLASAGFFLRSAGLALFAGWVFDAALRRRWRLMAVRAGLSLVPFLAWQVHVARVKASEEFRQPAYPYQRADYQFYNVPYSDNIALKDPFRPELGHTDAGDVVQRIGRNVVALPPAIGTAVTINQGYWTWGLASLKRHVAGDRNVAGWMAAAPLLFWGALVSVGVVLLFRRRDWGAVGFVGASLGLICLTPWPGQFGRYLSPLTPFFAVAGLLALQAFWTTGRAEGWKRLSSVAVVSVVASALAAQLYAVGKVWELRAKEPPMLSPSGTSHVRFFHDASWHGWEKAVLWLKENAPAGSVVATTSPHLLHLWTGLKAVFPPFEIDPVTASEQLAAVPVRFVIIDELKFLEVSRRYARPAMERFPGTWKSVYSEDGTHIYERAPAE